MRDAFGIPSAPDIDNNDGISTRNPKHRIGRLKRGVLRGITRLHASIEKPSRIERDVLAIRRPGDDRRDRTLVGGAKDVCIKGNAVAHPDRDVALDEHRMLVLEDAAIDRRFPAAFLGSIAWFAIAILVACRRHAHPSYRKPVPIS